MERGLKSAEAYRATALLCRQQAACDPDNSWRLLGEAERWEYLAEQILASRQKSHGRKRQISHPDRDDRRPAFPVGDALLPGRELCLRSRRAMGNPVGAAAAVRSARPASNLGRYVGNPT